MGYGPGASLSYVSRQPDRDLSCAGDSENRGDDMSSVDATLPTPESIIAPETVRERFRTLALGAGVLLIGAFLSVFNYITDVAGGTILLAIVVSGALVIATKIADSVSERTATIAGVALFVGGLLLYLATVPRVIGELIELDFFVALFSYTTGISVLQFLRVDVWAVALAPAPTFLTWYLLLRRRYGASVVVGSLALGFFAFTGDASEITLLAGVLGACGVLAFGTLEQVDGGWEHVEQLGLLVVLVVLAARTLELIPKGNTGGFGGGLGVPTLEASLLSADDQVEVLGSISLSPEVRFTIESSRPGYWHAASYDRYTGNSWIRTGQSSRYISRLNPPPGPSQTVQQRVQIETQLESMPTAWKPVSIEAISGTDPHVTALEGLHPAGTFSVGDSYQVVSEVPARGTDALQNAGDEYPDEVRERYLEVPETLPDRVREHTEAITRDAETALEMAASIEQWLTANKQYSLRVNRPTGDIVDGFIFGMEEGYCVYFASAMTVMLRTQGVPARFTVGYSTGQEVDDGRWVVRGLDSHAWVEVYFPEIGWIPFDPTPGVERTSRRERRLQVARNRNATNVDTGETRQNSGGNGDAALTPTPRGSGPTPGEDVTITVPGPSVPQTTGTTVIPDRYQNGTNAGGSNSRLGSPVNGTATVTADGDGQTESLFQRLAERDRISVLAGLAGVVLGVHHFGLVGRFKEEVWLRHQPRTDSPIEDVERAYARLEGILARRHRPRQEGETPRQYVSAIEDAGASLDDRVHHVATIYERTRYAGEASREEADDVIDVVDGVVSDGDSE